MESKIRAIQKGDKNEIVEMMQIFYSSPAVLSNGSAEIFSQDVDNCTNDNPYLEGYVIENDKNIQGYAMIAKSFSTEFGKPCIWIEDLYVKEEYRGMGLGGRLLDYIIENHRDCIFRLEAEEENKGAIKLYERYGFKVLPYLELKK